MARIIATGPTPRRPNIFGALGTAFGDSFSQEMERRAEAERTGAANLSLLEMQARAGGLDPSLPSVPAGGEAPLVLQPDVREQAQAQAGDPRLDILRQLKKDPSILADPTRFAAVTKLVNPPKPEDFNLGVNEARFSGVTGQEIARNEGPVKASSAIGDLYLDRKRGLIPEEDFLAVRQNLLDAGRKGLQIERVGNRLISVDPQTQAVKVLYTGPSEAGDGRDRKRDSRIQDYMGFGLSELDAMAVQDGKADLVRNPDGSYGVTYGDAENDANKRLENDRARAAFLRELNPELTEAQAFSVATGKRRVEVGNDGIPRLVDDLAGGASEISVQPAGGVDQGGLDPVGPPPGKSLWDLAEGATGPMAAAEAGLANVAGIVGIDVSTDILDKRRSFMLVTNDMIRAFSNNQRYPVGEADRVLATLSILPSLFKSPEALRANLETTDRYLSILEENTRRSAADPKMRDTRRGELRDKFREIRAFRKWLKVPGAVYAPEPGASPPASPAAPAGPEVNPDGTVNLTPEEFRALPPEERRRLMDAARKAKGG